MALDIDLKGKQFQGFQEALEQAFPDYGQLRIMVMHQLGEDLPGITPPAAMPMVIFELIRWARAHGKLSELLAGALEANPDSPHLRRFAFEVALTSEAPPAGRLEAKVLQGIPFTDSPISNVAAWRERMVAAERCVCRIEIPAGTPRGTGFLVGRDIVLTNWHVAEYVQTMGLTPDQVVVRFDYKAEGGNQHPQGQACVLASDHLLDHSPVKDLDYALLRLAENAGDARGFLKPEPYDFPPDAPLFILQHPAGEPMIVQVGTIVSVNSLHKRVNYTTNTTGGSSGSPCFTMGWSLVALHHYGQQTSNMGIPLKDIQERVRQAKPSLADELDWVEAQKPAPSTGPTVAPVKVEGLETLFASTEESTGRSGKPVGRRVLVLAGAVVVTVLLLAVLIKTLIERNDVPENGSEPEITNTTSTLDDPEDQGVAREDDRQAAFPAKDLPVWEKAIAVPGRLVAYSSPDSSYEVLQKLLQEAKTSILIGMYDFSSSPVKDLLLDAMEEREERKVKVTLLLDSNQSEPEQKIIEELRQKGADVIKVPGGKFAPFFVYHPKVIVVDRLWTLVQSANLTATGIPAGDPLRRPGNREMGIAVESRELAEHFTKVLEDDIELARKMESQETGKEEADPRYKPYVHVPHFPAFSPGETTQPSAPPQSIRVLPVLTPDNYMEVLPEVLAAARQSIEIELPYIRDRGPHVPKLLQAIKTAQDKNLAVRIILSRASAKEDLDKLSATYGLRFGENLRVLDRRTGMHLNNKLVIVDRKVSLVGSANWSDAGVSRSREVCLLIDSGDIAGHYGKIFQADWSASSTPLNPD